MSQKYLEVTQITLYFPNGNYYVYTIGEMLGEHKIERIDVVSIMQAIPGGGFIPRLLPTIVQITAGDKVVEFRDIPFKVEQVMKEKSIITPEIVAPDLTKSPFGGK